MNLLEYQEPVRKHG